ncbi:MAG: sugar transferase [Acidobacteria bacterium]|nr:sugar transferase [Acidobacteriota bacterium]
MRNAHIHHPVSEPEFRRTLANERLRCERSGNALLLAILHFEGSEWEGRAGESVRGTLWASLGSAIRSTDVIGWYEEERSAGLLFIDLRTAQISAAVENASQKIACVLQGALPAHALQQIQVTYHLFPEGACSASGHVFYPQQAAAPPAAVIAKRAIDIAGSAIALVALAPLLLATALAVKLTSEGPVWCRQKRVGKGGRTFTLLKFRSMFQNCDCSPHHDYVRRMIAGEDVAQEGKGHVFKLVNDPRVTPLGRILRRTSLDEVPQFLNVLLGHMSLVGPRPPLPYEFDQYSSWHRRRVLEVKPGLTGLWQVEGRSQVRFDDMVRLDLRYAHEWSLWLDLKILLKTPAAVLRGTGAY